MGRGDPLPVAVALRDFGKEDRGGVRIRVPGAGAIRATKPAMVATATQKYVTCFMRIPPPNIESAV